MWLSLKVHMWWRTLSGQYVVVTLTNHSSPVGYSPARTIKQDVLSSPGRKGCMWRSGALSWEYHSWTEWPQVWKAARVPLDGRDPRDSLVFTTLIPARILLSSFLRSRSLAFSFHSVIYPQSLMTRAFLFLSLFV